jgi:putative oxidoreductase
MEVQAMDWKGLVQFALMGNANLEQYAILLVRVSIGLFFVISGANKLFVAGGTKPVSEKREESTDAF